MLNALSSRAFAFMRSSSRALQCSVPSIPTAGDACFNEGRRVCRGVLFRDLLPAVEVDMPVDYAGHGQTPPASAALRSPAAERPPKSVSARYCGHLAADYQNVAKSPSGS